MCDEGETDKQWSDAALAVELPHVVGALSFSNEKWQEGIECMTSPKRLCHQSKNMRMRGITVLGLIPFLVPILNSSTYYSQVVMQAKQKRVPK